MAGEDNPFAKYAGQTAPVKRPPPVVRPGEEDRYAPRARRSEPELPQLGPPVPDDLPTESRALPAPVAEPAPTAEGGDNPFLKYAGKSVTAGSHGGKKPTEPEFDITGTPAEVRERIAALPEGKRKAALDKWADSYVANERKERGIGGTVDDYVRRAAEGVVGGWGDRLGAKLSSLTGTDYDEALAYEQAKTRAAHRATDQTKVATVPKFTLPVLGEVGGDITTGDLAQFAGGAAGATTLPVLRASRVVPFVNQAPASLAARAVDYGVTGGLTGAALGYGSGNTDEERLANAKHGAAWGTALGTGAPIVARGVGNVAGAVSDALTPLPQAVRNYNRKAIDNVALAFEHDAQPNTAAYGAEGMLGDAGFNMQATAAGLAGQPGPGMQIVGDAVTGRRRSAAGRINADVDATLGPAQNLVELEKRVTDQARRAADPYYKQFYSTPIQPTPRLQQLIDFAEKNGLTKAADDAMERYAVLNGVAPSPNMRLNFIKRQFDRLAQWAKTPAAGLDKDAAKDFKQFAHLFNEEVDRILSPNDPTQSPWAIGRRLSGEGFQFEEGLEQGSKAFSKATHPDQMAADLQGVSAPYEAGYVAGGRGQIRDMMGNAAAAYGANGDIAALKNLNAPYAQQKFATLVGPQGAQQLAGRLAAEARFNELYELAMKNAKTSLMTEVKKGIPNMAENGGSGPVHNLTVEGMVAAPVRKMMDVLTSGVISERNMRIVRDMADMLVSQGARREEIANALRQVIARQGLNGQRRGQVDRLIMHLMRGTAVNEATGTNVPTRLPSVAAR